MGSRWDRRPRAARPVEGAQRPDSAQHPGRSRRPARLGAGQRGDPGGQGKMAGFGCPIKDFYFYPKRNRKPRDGFQRDQMCILTGFVCGAGI